MTVEEPKDSKRQRLGPGAIRIVENDFLKPAASNPRVRPEEKEPPPAPPSFGDWE